MVLKSLLLLVCFCVMQFSSDAEENLNRISKLISKEFQIQNNEIDIEEWNFACKTETEPEEFYKLIVNNELIAYLVLTKAKGRYDYFDFFVLYNPDTTVRFAYVTSYFSDHGGEITSKRWLSQFEGYKGGELVYGRDIDAIAGATISAKSITSKVENITNQIRLCTIK